MASKRLLLLLETVVAQVELAIDSKPQLDLQPDQHHVAGVVVVIGGLLLISWLFSQILALPLLVHHRYRARGDGSQPATGPPQHSEGDGSDRDVDRPEPAGPDWSHLGAFALTAFSALLLMGCCRTQTPLSNDSRRNMFPT